MPTADRGWGPGVLELPCWADQDAVRLTCDAASGMWLFRYEESEDGFGGRYVGGKRVYPEGTTCSGAQDCDDLCASRCSGLEETCDGLDNDCSGDPEVAGQQLVEDGAAYDPAWRGLPTSMLAGLQPPGTIAMTELDLDGDGFAACEAFSADDPEPHVGNGSCAAALGEADLELSDCNPLCGLQSPASTERCNGFLDLCDGEEEGSDGDLDGLSTCGPWGSNPDMADEDVYVVMAFWASGIVDNSVDSVEPEPSIDEFDTGTPSSTDSGDAGTGEEDSGREETGDDDTDQSDTGAPLSVSRWNGYAVPLILPRAGDTIVAGLPKGIADCDQGLVEELLAFEEVVGQQGIVGAAVRDADARRLVELCDPDIPGVTCQTVRLTLSATSDDAECDSNEPWTSGKKPNCGNASECAAAAEEITRTVWTPARIKQSRRVVTEWDCVRTFGMGCSAVDEKSTPTAVWMGADLSEELDEALAGTAGLWWRELGRYEPVVVPEMLAWCWGDPVEDLDDDEQRVGGDCDDERGGVSRDEAEGPDDLLGIYYARLDTNGYPADCDACLDGIDNNCDGLMDCADPTCAVCFVGQGSGCGGGTQSPCAQSGCAAWTSDARRHRSQGLVLSLLVGLFILVRRPRRAA
jgi:hypothetical protein